MMCWSHTSQLSLDIATDIGGRPLLGPPPRLPSTPTGSPGGEPTVPTAPPFLQVPPGTAFEYERWVRAMIDLIYRALFRTSI